MTGTVDRLEKALSPSTGLIGVVDFSVSAGSSAYDDAVGSPSRYVSWLSRIFWLNWFALVCLCHCSDVSGISSAFQDHVDTHEHRRRYLEWRFGSLKTFDGRNTTMVPYLASIPYYVWLGCHPTRDVSKAVQAFEIDSGNTVSALVSPFAPNSSRAYAAVFKSSPMLTGKSSNDEMIPEYSLDRDLPTYDTPTLQSITYEKLGAPLTSFHYNVSALRVPYVQQEVHNEFRSWIYGFTWEDPADDIKHFGLTQEDSMLVITSAGCNALHYAISARPKLSKALRVVQIDTQPVSQFMLWI